MVPPLSTTHSISSIPGISRIFPERLIGNPNPPPKRFLVFGSRSLPLFSLLLRPTTDPLHDILRGDVEIDRQRRKRLSILGLLASSAPGPLSEKSLSGSLWTDLINTLFDCLEKITYPLIAEFKL